MGFTRFYFPLSLFCFTGLVLRHVYAFPVRNPNQDFVDAHNAARAQVGVGPLSWNHTLAAYALNFPTRNGTLGGPYGENLAEGYGLMTGEEAVKFWLTEKQYYDYHSNSYVEDECLHFTLVVWQKSVHLGCARIKCHNGWMFVICSYDPPGNIEGQRPY
ncbi:hypothetical protein FNV43_RR19270 [Rhamnella rubrinervis]|uniref:SCP domain-containing protein n=1 Tax=Rhamnella rubrinervis TaxID=2594499 RepID=A0A8K0E7M5_9ROSA|nr:hypothetical protein FNV43_RR19270 [Rhamnella rubrinervis]